ncbi:MAG: hypothetical protein LBP85_02595, partial [Prevotellaceae bacterium]|nr:hypothetical protein [Prevotellaceae bacterium]
EDAFKRLLKPSIETEFANAGKEKADKEAVRVFAENLRQLACSATAGYALAHLDFKSVMRVILVPMAFECGN